MSKTIIISGFPGIGKTYMANVRWDPMIPACADCESSNYQWKKDPLGIAGPTRIENWVQDYVDDILKLRDFGDTDKGYYDFILISTHEEVRHELRRRKVEYLIVYPNIILRNEYMIRYLKRGSSVDFLKKMYDTWNDKICSMIYDPMPAILLEKGQYLRDLFN